jgi:hypothetical protein
LEAPFSLLKIFNYLFVVGILRFAIEVDAPSRNGLRWQPSFPALTAGHCPGAGAGLILPPTVCRTKVKMIYLRTKNLSAVQLLLGHTELESTVRYLGVEVDDALVIA